MIRFMVCNSVIFDGATNPAKNSCLYRDMLFRVPVLNFPLSKRDTPSGDTLT